MSNNNQQSASAMKRKFSFGLRFKFVSAISLILLITLGAAGYYSSYIAQGLLTDSIDKKARALGQFVALISPEAIYSYDITTLDRFMQQISNLPDIHFAVIISSNNKALTTYHPKDISFKDIYAHLNNNANNSDEHFKKNYLLSFPIIGQEKILGKVVIAIDTSELTNIIKYNLFKQLFIYLCIVVFLGIIFFWVFYFQVLRPVNELIFGSKLVSYGTFDKKVRIYSNDELGQLAKCFNKMTYEISEDRSKLIDTNTQLKLAASVFVHAREGITITDKMGNIIDVNKAFTHITGYQKNEVIGKNPRVLKSGQHTDKFYSDMWDSLLTKGHWYGEIWNKRKNGEIYPETLTISSVYDGVDRISHFVALFADITEKVKHQQQLEHIAHYDALTGLPNRMLLADRMRQAISQTRRHQYYLGVVYLDLDGFKEINDNYGHEVGDKLLIKISSLMTHVLRSGDTISRVGGDEFIIVLNALHVKDDSISLLERLNQSASEIIYIEGRKLQVSASVGISFWSIDNDIDAEQLIRQADQAMYQAKLSGKNRFHIFDKEHDENIRGINEDINNINQALKNEEFVLYYQPKVNMSSGEFIGVEALIRWQHPDKGLLSPIQFLPFIENHPLSVEVGKWVIKTALNQMKNWLDTGLDVKMSINISAMQLQSHDFVSYLDKSLNEFNTVPAKNLQLEILETSALENINNISQLILSCNELNVDFALDDFGTGYSSLTYLKRLPVSQLKIDRSFVKDMLFDTEDLAIFEGILGLASAFKREVIAEGVESEEHGIMLLNLGCELGQGFTIAKPMPAEKLKNWINNWQPYDSWKAAKYIEKSNVSILRAIVEHQAWAIGIKNFMQDEIVTFPDFEHDQCRFSVWLNGEGKHRYGTKPNYDEVIRLHTKIHAIAKSMLSKKLSKKHLIKEFDITELEEFEHHRDLLVKNLKRLL